jgi:hypothetical protein
MQEVSIALVEFADNLVLAERANGNMEAAHGEARQQLQQGFLTTPVSAL